jgi:energy-coupling factor transporter ATP-binding protein EcfA2
MFDDQGIERSQTIAPALIQAIRESRISIVVLSKNYASSSWCLNELVEILKCKDVVMPIFYEVDPSDVRKQTGDFGKAFKNSCKSKTKEERQRWIQALIFVGNIAGEHSLKWENEADMIEKIAKDVSDKLNATPSKDFDAFVGLEFHIRELSSLLYLDYEQVRIVGICGPAGIGKTTIARALQSLLSSNFQRSCFMENVRGSLNIGLDEYGLKLDLQERLLSKIMNQKGMRIEHLGTIRDRLHDQKVLIILDDVNDLDLYALADQTTWFGPGSRIIVTTEDNELLQKHDINNVYHVDFPSRKEALEIFCRCAFRQSSAPDTILKLAERVTELCGNLPLGLCVIGSSLHGKTEDEWEILIRRLEISLDRDNEAQLRVGYDSLHENEQALFLSIAVFFNYKDRQLVMAMLLDSNLDVEYGLRTLANKSLIHISRNEKIVMHNLLQHVGRQAIQRQEPWKRHILIDADEICNVLENDTDARIVSGISFDISRIGEVFLSERAFKRLCNLQFLRVFKTGYDEKNRVRIPENMEFPPRLRLLQWEAYPRRSLSLKLNLEYLVELDMEGSLLEKLWDGTQVSYHKFISLMMLYIFSLYSDVSTLTSGLHSAPCKSQEDVFVKFMVFKETSGSVKCYKSRRIGSESLPEFSRASFLLFLSA